MISFFRRSRAAPRPSERPRDQPSTILSAVYRDQISRRLSVESLHAAIDAAELGDPRDLYGI